MTAGHYQVVSTDAARQELRDVEGADRLAGIPPGVLPREGLRALLAGTALGELLDALDDLAPDPYGGLSLARTEDTEDDRTALHSPSPASAAPRAEQRLHELKVCGAATSFGCNRLTSSAPRSRLCTPTFPRPLELWARWWVPPHGGRGDCATAG